VRRLTLRIKGLRPLFFCLLLLLAGCGGGGSDGEPVEKANPAIEWQISQSVNMPAALSPHADGWSLDFPQAGSSVHYVTKGGPTGALAGKTLIRMAYRIEAGPGVRIVPRSDPESPSMLTLYFQRAGDTWTASHEAYRWFAAFSRPIPITAGEHVITARLDGPWSAASVSTRDSNPAGFAAALEGAGRIGFVLGGGTGAGHGVYATGQARLVLKSFTVE
jgi:hypothetical protein